jgi:TolB-like protein/tetratricopeptide (TPR) repeat protein
MKQEQLELLRAALASRYRVERELGHGGMATVYLARDLKHGRPVAIKVLRPEFAAVLGSERFLREIQIAARLQHPHILPLYDSGEADGTLYYIMPYVEGESLRDRLAREGPLPLADALRIAGDVAQALSHAHARDVVHRDIKPENILLEGDRAVVADFGIARAVTQAAGDRLTQTGIAVGTPVYMSPEQAGAESQIDGRSDIYSLGCVVYEMLAGHPPFTGRTAQEVMARHSMDTMPSLRAARPNMSDGVEAAIFTALEKSPADRFATASQFAEALSDSGPRTLRRGWPPARHVAIGAAAAAVIVALWIGAVILWSKNGADGSASSRVVVMPFENRTALNEFDPLGIVTAEWLTQGLAQASFLTVLDTRGAQAIAGKLGVAPTPADVGRETGAGVVVAGSYVLQGDSLEFQARISSTGDNRILVSIGGVSAPRDRPMAGVERLQQRLLGAFASLHDKDISSFQTTLAQPPSYVAYRAYVEGIEAYLVSEMSAARDFLRAATLDSSFLGARIWAAQAGVLGGRNSLDDSWVQRADSLLSGLQPIRDRLSLFDRARLDFVVALRAGNSLASYDAALRLVTAAPGSVDARREAALAAMRVLRPREALKRFQELDPRRGLMRGWEGTYWAFVADPYHHLGEYEAELIAIRRARQLPWVDARWLLYGELRALAALGRIGELDSLVRAEVPANWSQRDLFVFGVAGELLAHGHPEAAHRLAQNALDHPSAPPPREQVPAREWILEHMGLRKIISVPFCYLEQPVEQNLLPGRARDDWLHWRVELALLLGAADTAAALAAQLHDPEAHGLLLARLLATEGKLDAARAIMVRWESRMLRSRGTLSGLEMERAAALVRLGDRDRALEILAEGIGRHFLPNAAHYWDGHAYPEFAPLLSDPRFRALIKPRG